MLIAMQYDIELQQQFILQHKLFLQKAVGSFINMKADYEPNSQADKILEAKISRLNEAEKILDIRLEMLKARHEAIAKERERLAQLINKNIQTSFGNAYGMGR